MKRITTGLFITFLCLFLVSCFASFPKEQIPQTEISESELDNYVIAYCWQDPNGKQSILSEEDKEVVIVLSYAYGENKKIISNPYNNEPSASNMVIFKNGCISDTADLFRMSWYSLSWRPNSDEITFAWGSDWSLSDFGSRSIVNNEIIMNNFNEWIQHSDDYFLFPRGIYWSHNGEKNATLGRDFSWTPPHPLGDNIWITSGDPTAFTKITNITEVGDFIANVSWSIDDTKLAIMYRKSSGLAIVSLDDQNQVKSYIDVTSEQFDILSEYWPHAFNSWLQLLYDYENMEFNSYISIQSIPVWINNDQQIIFTATSSSDQGTLFIVDSDGTNLKPFLPDLSGLIFMPRLSADGKTLAFVRYPSWKTRDKVEIATVDIYTKEISSLIVLYSQTDEDLIISGMNWSPDGKFLMFSSNHAGESDIYIITSDGSAWKNITENIDGNAVGPIWKP